MSKFLFSELTPNHNSYPTLETVLLSKEIDFNVVLAFPLYIFQNFKYNKTAEW